VDLWGRMALNPNFNQIGQAFVQQYYAIFDNPATRGELAKLYNTEQVSAGSLSWQYHDEYL